MYAHVPSYIIYFKKLFFFFIFFFFRRMKRTRTRGFGTTFDSGCDHLPSKASLERAFSRARGCFFHHACDDLVASLSLSKVYRLRGAEEAETRLPLSHGTRAARRNRPVGEQEWIQCCDRNCGKWRSLHRSMNASDFEGKEWYCVMNRWVYY